MSHGKRLTQYAKKCNIAIVKTGPAGSWIKRGDEVIRVDALQGHTRWIPPVPAISMPPDFFTASHTASASTNAACSGQYSAGKVIEVVGARMPEEKWKEAKEMIREIAED
ncbi:MAG: hypothetical protein MZV63_51050 [Marinilabiliales bacterium]|nr:hypothetical protein [Marinilabiliales bacterium]